MIRKGSSYFTYSAIRKPGDFVSPGIFLSIFIKEKALNLNVQSIVHLLLCGVWNAILLTARGILSVI